MHRLTLTLCVFATAALAQVEVPPPPVPLPVDADICRFAPTCDYLSRSNYLVSFDGSRRVPRWTLEKLTRESLAGDASRDQQTFYRDPETPDEFAPEPRDYAGSMFDRGHLAAAANHRASEEAMSATFTLANIMPQNPNLNRRAWAALEQHVRELATAEGVRCCWVVTAPAWLADDPQFVRGAYVSFLQIRTIGKHGVWVPTHCAKALLIEREDGTYQMRSWLMRNGETVDPRLEKHEVTANAIERACGINLWSDLPDELEERMESEK